MKPLKLTLALVLVVVAGIYLVYAIEHIGDPTESRWIDGPEVERFPVRRVVKAAGLFLGAALAGFGLVRSALNDQFGAERRRGPS